LTTSQRHATFVELALGRLAQHLVHAMKHFATMTTSTTTAKAAADSWIVPFMAHVCPR